jgi:DNA primase large subunit
MKKIFLLLAVSLLLITGCKKENNITKMSLKSILKASTKGAQLPDNYITKITKDNFEDYFGDADIDFKEAIVSEANINAIAYMIGIIRLNDNEDTQKAVDILKKSVDLNRWICVVPDSVIIDNNQNVIIVIMDEKNNADTIHNNFKNIK